MPTKKAVADEVEEKSKVETKERLAQEKAKHIAERHAAFLKTLKAADKALSKDDDKLIALLEDMKVDVERFSTGSFVLDTITGGGFPHGRIIELYGPESSGKTSIALNSVANVQKEGGNCVFVDAENAFDPHYAHTLGVNLGDLGFSQSAIAEDVLGLCLGLAKSGDVDLIVVDSVAALSPRAESEGGMEKQQMGALARSLSKGLRLLTPICAKNNCTIIFLNQTREKVGVMFGNPETTPGGRALKFYASQRIEVRRREVVKEGGKEIGTKVKLKVVKNKVAAPFGEGFTVLTFAHGINHAAELVVVGEDKKIIYKKTAQSASFYDPLHPEDPKFKDIALEKEEQDGRMMYKLGRGQAAAMQTLVENPALYEAMSSDIKEVLDRERNGDIETSTPAPEPEESDDKGDFDFES